MCYLGSLPCVYRYANCRILQQLITTSWQSCAGERAWCFLCVLTVLWQPCTFGCTRRNDRCLCRRLCVTAVVPYHRSLRIAVDASLKYTAYTYILTRFVTCHVPILWQYLSLSCQRFGLSRRWMIVNTLI